MGRTGGDATPRAPSGSGSGAVAPPEPPPHRLVWPETTLADLLCVVHESVGGTHRALLEFGAGLSSSASAVAFAYALRFILFVAAAKLLFEVISPRVCAKPHVKMGCQPQPHSNT